jgi:pyruvate-ferredoxin/flavodoxin oxidoreductase
MIPNMFKIAGEQTATVFHIAARALATHALSIFGDHSDVMSARSCGWAMLFGNSVQEAMDFALVSQAATLRSRVPFLHIFAQRGLVAALKAKLSGSFEPEVRDLHSVADALVRKSVWIVGGDGWAYDIGFGGLDHVVASGANVNILVLDTEVYSNTGGQSSKSTPMGAVAKFAAGGKATPKKDLRLMAAKYGNVYVAQVAMGASDAQTMKAFTEAEAHEGPSLIIAYSHCIAHGIDIAKGLGQQKLAVESGHLAPLPLQSRARRTRREPVPARLFRPEDSLAGLHLHGDALPHASAERPRGRAPPPRPRAGGRQRALAAVQGDGEKQESGVRIEEGSPTR